MSWPVLLGALLVAGTASPPTLECEPVLGGELRPGRWGVVHLLVTNSSGRPCRVELAQAYPQARQATAARGELEVGGQGEYLLPVRALSAEPQLVAEISHYPIKFPVRVAAGGGLAVVVVGVRGTPPPLPVESAGYARAGMLPKRAAEYEAADVLVIGAASGLNALQPEQAVALSRWFRAGGRVVVDSPEALLVLSGVLRGEPERKLPADRAGWLKLLGAPEKDVRLWDGDRPAVALFRCGFGRGLYAELSRASALPAWAEAAKAAYRELLEGRPGNCAPLAWPGLYSEPGRGDIPALDRAVIGAGAALRWALGAALLIAAAGAAAWRRSRPWRLVLAASAAGLLAALGIALAVHPVQFRTLSLRVEEYCPPDGGARVREYLYVERAGGPAATAVHCSPDALPGPILFNAAEGSGISWNLQVPPAGEAAESGVVLSGLEFRERSLWLGAGPLRANPREEVPSGASCRRDLAGLSGPEAVGAVADCLADPGSRCRAQAEFLARWLVREAHAGAADVPVTVCRLPESDADVAMRVDGAGVRGERLHPLGVFYGGAR